MRIAKLLSLLAVLVFLIQSCTEDVKEFTGLDLALTDAVKKSSPTGELEFYKLPVANDFNSLPQDEKNILTKQKITLGKFLFHETGLAINPNNLKSRNTYSCASCHNAKAGFQACIPQGVGEGGIGFGHRGEGREIAKNYDLQNVDVQPIRTPTAINVAYQKNMLWNGQFGATGQNAGTEQYWTENTPKAVNNLGYEGVETQAIAAMQVHHLDAPKTLFNRAEYVAMFNDAFPGLPTDSINNEHIGLAVAAYERALVTNEAPLQKWLNGEYTALTENEKKGALLFFSKAKCSTCHSGPSLSSMAFNALGMKDLDQQSGVLIKDEKEAAMANLGRGGFTNNEADNYKFKVPQLYNLADSPFYGHGASFTSLKKLVEYKNMAIKENPNVPDEYLDKNFTPLGLSNVEIDQLVEFLKKSLYDPSLERYVPKAIPSGNCFPNNDKVSVEHLGCS